MTKRTRKTLMLIGATFTALFLWTTLMEFLKINLLFHEKQENLLDKLFGGYLERTKIGGFIFPVIIAPLWEEALFRYAPLKLARMAGQKFVLPVVIISSLWFGWMHSNMNVMYILEQGVCGFAFAYVLIKSKYQYWSSVVLHALWNFAVLFAVQILNS